MKSKFAILKLIWKKTGKDQQKANETDIKKVFSEMQPNQENQKLDWPKVIVVVSATGNSNDDISDSVWSDKRKDSAKANNKREWFGGWTAFVVSSELIRSS